MKYIRAIWDKLILTPIGYIPLVVYLVGWPVAKTIALLTPSTLHYYWAYVLGLPISTGKQPILVFWLQWWVASQYYRALGYILFIMVVVVIFAKDVRGEHLQDVENSKLSGD